MNKLNTIAHIINPFDASPSSDLFTAQPITMKSMAIAQENAIGIADVELFITRYKEDAIKIEAAFIETNNLTRSVLDQQKFEKEIKLPLLIDILEILYHSSDAEYLIYTNVDIGLFPDFYLRVNDFINEGNDAFIINRRRISNKYKNIDQLEGIFSQTGKKHPGFDCFVFQRSIFPKLKLDGICIGVPFVEIAFSQNLFCLAQNFKLFDNEKLTFHIGMEIYKKRAPREYYYYNKNKFWKLIESLNPDLKKFPYANKTWPLRLIRWGLHPCIPIMLVLKLELKKLKKQ